MFFLINKLVLVLFFGFMNVNGYDAAIKPAAMHPFYVSVVEVQQNAKEKSLEISFRIFTDDLEQTLNQRNKSKFDITKSSDHPAFDKMIPDYISQHFSVATDGKAAKLNYVGFEVDRESAWCYFEVVNVPSLKKLDITTNILHDLTKEQINIIHTTINGKRQSAKLNYPDVKASFSF